ncbi:MAG: hypothetical protein HY291_00660 [Planctomycetes bacterium]|nr:hypothetical protein [Planctomycetota bacterium]
MQRGKWFVALGLVALLAAFLAYTASLTPGEQRADAPPAPPPASASGTSASDGTATAQPVSFTSSGQCIACHSQIFAEWRRDQHATSWTEAIFRSYSINYTKAECLSCHAPQPMLEVGLNSSEPKLREANRPDGVDCLTCHVKNGRTFGTLGSKAACGGTLEPELKTSQACYHCHATHNLFKEYLASDYPKRGISCQDCHMEKVRRQVADLGPLRDTRKHTFHNGGHDVEGLKKSLKLEAAVKDGKLTVTVTNIGAAHGVPGEINNRIVRLEISVQVKKGTRVEDGKTVDDMDETQAHEAIFQAPPRLARDKIPSTQIMPGVPRVLEYPLTVPHGKVFATLTYKLDSAMLNRDAVIMAQLEQEF